MANPARNPDSRRLIVLLNNTGGAPLDAMATAIRAVLDGKEPTTPKMPGALALFKTYESSGLAAALAQAKLAPLLPPPATTHQEAAAKGKYAGDKNKKPKWDNHQLRCSRRRIKNGRELLSAKSKSAEINGVLESAHPIIRAFHR